VSETAREAILAALRARSAGDAPEVERTGRTPGTPAGLDSPAARVARFRQRLEEVGGVVREVPTREAALDAVREIVTQLGARDVAASDGPLVAALRIQLGSEVAVFDGWRDRERLLACDLGISGVQGAIAETGTLVLDSALERNRLVSLVPPVHVALVERSQIVATLGDALAACRRAGRTPAALTFITGPSRTADIELTLVVGVHGPKELYVLIVGD